MCFEAGLKPHEYKGNYLEDNWLYIEAHTKRERSQWERTRAIAFNVAKFGNSDPKKFPKTITKFWQFPWETASQQAFKGESRAEQIRAQYMENQRILAEALAKQKQKKVTNGDS